ncbi:PQQ-binding-like beta-propeller repeat protein [Streptomyces sp. 147326]|uniref:outer membrane protein assembly factor BamB family protein n=1 Tax=Streptomyces sp. 147326 TaxID=3074379 RepID=UPI0038578342
MRTLPRLLTRSLLTLPALTLTLSACGSGPPPEEEISDTPVWTTSATGKRTCPQYSEIDNALFDVTPSEVTMRDAATGNTRWTQKQENASCPLVTKEAVYVTIKGKLLALDRGTGKEKAALEMPMSESRVPPVATPSGVHAGFSGDILTADIQLQRELWKHEETSDMWIDETEASNDTLVMATHNGKVKALSGKDGHLIWTYTTPTYGEIDATMSVDDGLVYFASGDGSLYAVDVTTGKEAWDTKLNEIDAWTPNLTGSMLITGGGEYLHGLDKKTGQNIWKRKIFPQVFIAAADQVIYATEPSDGKTWVTSLNAATGAVNWKFSSSSKIFSLAISSSHFFVWTETEIKAYELTTPK